MESRLDALESVFFKRELEAIDARVYQTVYPAYKARSLMPTQDGVADSDRVYTYRLYDQFGKAQFIANMGDDLPAGEATGDEVSQMIKFLGGSYSYDIFEIKAAAKTGRPLDSMKALGCRRALEEKVDEVLALGSTKHNLKGLLTLSSTTTFTPSTKAGGGTAWGTLALPVATGEEMALDIMGAAAKIVEASKGAFTRFRCVLPIEQYNLAASKRLGDGSDVTALKFALATSPFLESIEPWYRCKASLSGSALSNDRMCLFPYDQSVVAALVPMEFALQPPEQRNLKFVVNATASTGGVVCRYPVAICYADSI